MRRQEVPCERPNPRVVYIGSEQAHTSEGRQGTSLVETFRMVCGDDFWAPPKLYPAIMPS